MTVRPDEPSVGQLVGSIREDVTALVRGEIDLAKAELRESATRAGTGGALVAVAGYLVLVATVLLAIAAGYGLVAAGLGPAAAFLIVAATYLILALILGLVARGRFRRVGGPQRAQRTAGLLSSALRPGRRP
jgi:hypothetical protein